MQEKPDDAMADARRTLGQEKQWECATDPGNCETNS